MNNLLMTIALLCQATPGTTSTGGGALYFPESVRKSQAKCQQRLLKCVHSKSRSLLENLEQCVLDGAVFDPEQN